jgi:hypothetical protein
MRLGSIHPEGQVLFVLGRVAGEVGLLLFPVCSQSVLINISMGSQHVHQVASSSLLYPTSFALGSTLGDLAQK